MAAMALGRRVVLASILALAAGSAAADDVVTVGLVSKGNALQWPLFIAIDKGFFAEQGITADPIVSQSSPNLLKQIAAGAVNIGLPTTGDSFRAIAKGAPVIVVRIDTEHAPLLLMAKPAIKRIADLKGKTISIGAADGIDRYYLEAALKRGGIDPKTVDVLAGGGAANRFQALMAGAIDAAAISPPQHFLAEAKGYTNLGSLDVPGLPWTCYAGYRPWVEKNRGLVVRYLKAYSKAVVWLNDPAHKVEASTILTKWGRSKQPEVEQTYEFYQPGGFFHPRGELSRAALDKFVAVLTELKFVEPGIDPARFFDASYIAAAMKP